MNRLSYQKTGLAIGLFLGGWHLLWSVLVLAGAGQQLINFVLWAHMLHLQYVVGPFDLMASTTLILGTFVSGYLLGLVFTYVWNLFHRST